MISPTQLDCRRSIWKLCPSTLSAIDRRCDSTQLRPVSERRRSDVPPQFIAISSSLGEESHVSIVVLPILFEGETKAVIELATVRRFSDANLAFLDQLTVNIGAFFHTVEATMRTEGLLKQSRRLTIQLQSHQNELQQTNKEPAAQAKLLADQNAEVERKSVQVEQARFALQEKPTRDQSRTGIAAQW